MQETSSHAMSAADSPAPKPRPLPPDARRCQGEGRDGERCKAYAVRGQSLCAGHAGLGIAADPAAAQAASVRVRKEQAEDRQHVAEKAQRTVKQALAGLAEELVEELKGAYRAALRSGSADDLRRAQAAEYLLSRVYGKPAQPTRDETPTVATALAELDDLSLEELGALARGLPTPPRSA